VKQLEPAKESAPTPEAAPALVAIPDPAPTTTPVVVDARRLAAEVALLDRARTALRAGDTSGAIAALDRHRDEFRDGALAAEADVVRIEAAIQRGDHADARARGRTFLATFPQSPLARRVRSLIDRLPVPAQEAP
jgi:hypothetical protein